MANLQYACSSALADKATRCSTYAAVSDWPQDPSEILCTLHKNRKERGQEVRITPPVDILMLRFFLNTAWNDSFQDTGVTLVEKNIDNTIKIENEAERLGRNPYRYERGETPDSGVSVFGKTKDGLQGVAVDSLLFELATAEYLPMSCYRSPKPNGAVWLTASFSRVLKNGSVPDEALGCLARFMQASFDHIHIWSNPLQPPRHLITSGTLNAAGRKPVDVEDEETPRLKFAGGLWTVQ